MYAISDLGTPAPSPLDIAKKQLALDLGPEEGMGKPLTHAQQCWRAVTKKWKSGNDPQFSRDNYRAVFREWSVHQRKIAGGKSTMAERFRSAVQQADRKAQVWPPVQDGQLSYGVKLTCKKDRLYLDAVTRPSLDTDPRTIAVVKRFYSFISMREFEAAWNLLLPTFQSRRWAGDFGDFVRGYADFLTMQDLLLIPRTQNKDRCMIDAFFEEKRNLPEIPALTAWTNLKIGEVSNQLPALMKAMTETFESLGADAERLNKLPFKQLFYEDALTAVPWELKISSDRVEAAFPDVRTKELRIGRRIYLSLESDQWLIDRITWLNS